MCRFIIDTRYFEETFEVAVRSGSGLEFNHYVGEYSVYRLYSGSDIYVVSGPVSESDLLFKRLMSIARRGSSSSSIYCSEFYSGEYRLGRGVDPSELVEFVRDVSNRVSSQGLSSEVIVLARRVRAEHSVKEYGVRAVDDRWIYELYLYIYTVYMGSIHVSGELYATNNYDDLVRAVDPLINDLVKKLYVQIRSRRFNPVYSGSWNTLLTGDSACAFIHELMHLLEADQPVKLRIGSRIGGDLRIVENPFHPGPLQRVFDDELYPGWRRVLVEDGVVIDYLRSRSTVDGSRPGNGRGLFTKPKPMYHQVVVDQGDWSFDEVIEESRRVAVVDGLLEAQTFSGYIRIIPETVVIYERGEPKPVKNLEILIPVNKLSDSLIGLTREINTRYSYEKNQPIYETTPSILLETKITT